MQFGLNIRNKLTGADISVKFFQIVSILPVIYILILSGYPALAKSNNVFSFAFDFGFSCLPKYETLLLSKIYQLSLSEVLFVFLILGVATLTGLICAHFLKKNENASLVTHYVILGSILADIICSLLPPGFNSTFGTALWIVSLLIKCTLFVITLLDILVHKKKNTLQ